MCVLQFLDAEMNFKRPFYLLFYTHTYFFIFVFICILLIFSFSAKKIYSKVFFKICELKYVDISIVTVSELLTSFHNKYPYAYIML